MKTKKTAIFIILSAILQNMYAADISGLLGQSSLFDIMFAEMIIEFFSYKFMFIEIMQTIAVSVAVIGAFWWVMKIILMGESVEKAIVDILTKIFIYIVLVMVFPKIVDGNLSFATSIGISRGMTELNAQFAEMAAEIQIQMVATQEGYIQGIIDKAKFSKNGETKEIKDKVIKDLAKKEGINEGILRQRLQDAGVSSYKGFGPWKKSVDMGTQTTDYIRQREELQKQIEQASQGNIEALIGKTPTTKDNKALWEHYEKTLAAARAASANTRKKLKKVAINGMTYKDCQTRLMALARICMTEDEQNKLKKDMDEAKNKLQPLKIEQVMRLDPWLDVSSSVSKDQATATQNIGGDLVLSPSALMKIGILVASLANTQTNASVNAESDMDENDDEKSNNKDSETKSSIGERIVSNFLFEHLMQFVINLVVVFGTLMCSIYMVIQYIMMILEYYIVMAIAYMLLPLIMWEVTASYTKGLIKLIVSYFLKTMVLMIALCWAYRTFMSLANLMTTGALSADPIGMLVNVVFTLILCMAFVGEAPKIAQTILTGTPDMSMGEFMKQAAFTGHAAMKGAKATGKAAGKLAGGAAKTAYKVGVMAKQMNDVRKEKKAETSPSKQMDKKAGSELAAAKKSQTAAGNKVADAKKEQSAAQGNFNSAHAKASESQKAYNDAKKAAEGKGENSKEVKAMHDAEKQMKADKQKEQAAKRNLHEKNLSLKNAEMRKADADKTVSKKEQQKKETHAMYQEHKRNTPGAMNAAGSFIKGEIGGSKPVRFITGGQSHGEFVAGKSMAAKEAREKKVAKANNKKSG